MAENFEDQQYGEDRVKMLKAFDETNAGVKGLIDSGLQKIPKIFLRPSDELAQEQQQTAHENDTQIQIPVIDLSDIRKPEGRKRIVQEVKGASETWGFFQVVNHGISTSVLDGMIEGIKKFNEQDAEEKKKLYSRDLKRRVRFNSSYDLFTSKTATWKDTLGISFPNDHTDIPASCRESSVEYSKHVEVLGYDVLGLLSEALGLEIDHLEIMECCNGHRIHSHYYPACPEPQLVIGTPKHSDPGFITILLQSQGISALQVLHQGQWVDIRPTPGALVINLGDLLQLVSNDRFKSSEHRAKANPIGPRISVACFFAGPVNGAKTYGPIKELISEENPPIYKDDIMLGEYVLKFLNTGLDNYRALDYYKL